MQSFGFVVANYLDVFDQTILFKNVPQGDMMQSKDLRIGGVFRQPKEGHSLVWVDQIAAQLYLFIRLNKLFDFVWVHRLLVVRTSEKEGFGRQAVVVLHHRGSGQNDLCANSAASTYLVRINLLALETRTYQANCWAFDFITK